MSLKNDTLMTSPTPAEESSACGVGFVASADGEASNLVLQKGIELLTKMEHRGGVSAIPDWERQREQYISLKQLASLDEQLKIDSILAEIDSRLENLRRLKENPDYQEQYTSDGRGLMVEVDQEYYAEKYADVGEDKIAWDKNRPKAVGMVYLPKNNSEYYEICRKIMIEELSDMGYAEDARLREAGKDEHILGEAARDSMPRVFKLMIPMKDPTIDHDGNKIERTPEEIKRFKAQFDRDVFFLRKRIEERTNNYFKSINVELDGSEDFYIPSLSRHSIVFKGLSIGNKLTSLFRDLQKQNYKTRYGVPHSRFATNTSANWRRSHPYRHIAHNGEINSLQTNINMIGRLERIFSKLYPDDPSFFVENVLNKPIEGIEANDLSKIRIKVDPRRNIIQDGGTDSAMLDNVVEFLIHAGLTPAAMKMLLVPEAYEDNPELSEDVKNTYRYIDTITQPFDGPNTMMIVGNGQIAGGGDRSGYRPNRVKKTLFRKGDTLEDGTVLEKDMSIWSLASEDIDLGGEDEKKWNQEPGEMIAVDIKSGHLTRSDELKQQVAKEIEEIFGVKDFLKRIQTLKPQKINNSHYAYMDNDKHNDLKLQQRLGNITQEHIDFAVEEAATGKEPRGSMGDDAALAISSPIYRTFDNLFQENFAQVTKPPKDTVREASDMSLRTTIGSPVDIEGNFTNNQIIELESPILSKTTFSALREKIGEHNIAKIDCSFDIRGDESELKHAIERIEALAIAATKAGKQIVLSDKNVNKDRAAVPMLLASGAVHTALLRHDLRDQTSINVESRQLTYSHSIAAMIGLGGADTVNAYAIEETIAREHQLQLHSFKGEDALYGPQTSLEQFLLLYPVSDRDSEGEQKKKTLERLKKKDEIRTFFEQHADETLKQLATDDATKDTFEKLMKTMGISVSTLLQIGSVEGAIKNKIKSSEKAFLKIMGQEGISHVSAYRGGRMFEALGVGDEIIQRCFPNVKSPVKGLNFSILQQREIDHHKKQYAKHTKNPEAPIKNVGRNALRAGDDSEPHVYTSEAITILQDAVKEQSFRAGFTKYKRFKRIIENGEKKHRFAPRNWMDFVRKNDPVPIGQVEKRQDIVKRFFTGAMSFGSISEEAHTTLAEAMNGIGAKSNSGEGGELRSRLGTNKRSKMKQVASGRFGVDLDYLIDAGVTQIKMAQGAKPGLGGELPGKKVQGDIAIVRGVKEGTDLVSPPPHHDIYSIEDLEQLICDLKHVNPNANTDVKLVSSSSVGIVSSGVAKAYADGVTISGSNGGTGASPQTSINHAGMPWETSVNQVHRTLIMEHLRERLSLSTDGGMRTGRDLTIAAMLGAEEFGFGLQALMSEGCGLLRICQTGKCSYGIATTDPELRKMFKGTPEHVQNMMMFIAEDMREIIAKLGFTSVDQIIGRTDLLEQVWGEDLGLDLSQILGRKDEKGRDLKPLPHQKYERKNKPPIQRVDPQRPNFITLGQEIIDKHEQEMMEAVRTGETFTWDAESLGNRSIDNQDRTFGARISYTLRKQIIEDKNYGRAFTAKEDSVVLDMKGITGQSFGAFGMQGITLKANGANDGVGKGLSGAKIVLSPRKKDKQISLHPEFNTIVGNAVLYGATKGQLYAAGRAGNRFAIRMSGGEAVVDGAGSHACNYVTGGTVAILGKVGRNFGAGMSGGKAFVYDEDDNLEQKTFKGSLDETRQLKAEIEKSYQKTGAEDLKELLQNWDNTLQELTGSRHKIHRISSQKDKSKLHAMVSKHFQETDDKHAKRLLDDWDNAVHKFKVVEGEKKLKDHPIFELAATLGG